MRGVEGRGVDWEGRRRYTIQKNKLAERRKSYMWNEGWKEERWVGKEEEQVEVILHNSMAERRKS